MAILGKWSGGVDADLNPTETWTEATTLFPTEDRNDSSTYSKTNATITLPASGLADGYLFVGAFEIESTANARNNAQGRFIQASGTGTFVASASSGYLRDNSEDREYVRTWAFVDGPSASSTFTFQWKRDQDDINTGDGSVRSELQVIPFYYADAGLYSSSTAATYGGTTPNQVTGFTGTDGTNITLTSDTVTVTGDNKRYLALGGYFMENHSGSASADRTQRWHGFRIDGTKEDAAKGYTYYRDSENDEGGEMFTWMIETVTASRTIDMFCYRGDGVSALQGGANGDGVGTESNAAMALVVLELNDNAEVFLSRDNTQSALLATTGPVDLQINTVTDFNDTASFTDLVDTSINVVQTADYLFGANISAASNAVSNTTRWTAYSEFTINGTEDADSVAGDYMRNNQSSDDTFGWSANLLGFQALTAGDDVGVSVTELSGSEGGGAAVSPAGWSGFWGINLDTLEGSTPVEVNTLYNANNTLAIVEYVASIDLDIKGTAAALTLTEYAASITAYPAFDNQAFDDANSFDVGAFSLEASSAPTEIDATTDALTLTEAQATVALDVDIDATTDALLVATYDANIGLDIQAGFDALAIATYDANIGYDLQAGVDTLVIATFDANIGWDVQAGVDSLTIATYDANIGYDLQAGVDALTLATYQSTVSLGVDISTNVDALTLAEQQATIVYDVTVDTNVDALVVATYDANIGIDVKAGVDALTLATYQSTVNAETNVDTVVDALTLTEYVATVEFGLDTNVNTNLDSLTLTEYQATVNAATNIAAKVWASELVSLTANINAAINVDTNVDALTVATYQATAATGAISFDNTSFDEPNAFDVNAFAINAEISDTEVSTNVDALVLTENQATVMLDVYVDQQATTALTIGTYVADIGFVIPAVISFDQQSFDEPEAFSINSFAIEVGTPGVNTNLAELTLTEYPATILADREVSAGTDALTLTTYAAQLDQDNSIDANTNALVLTEYQANIANDGVMMAGSTTLTLNENKASIVVGVQGSSDALVLTEYQSTITLDVNVQTNVDALTLAESAAAIKISANDKEIAAGVDLLNISTYAATIEKDAVIETNVDALVLTTYQADVGLDLRVLAGFDALVINTFAVDTPVFTPNVRAVPVSLVLTEYRAAVQGPGGAGGASRKQEKDRLKKREEARKLLEQRNKELVDKIFGETSPDVKKVLTEGKGDVSGIEVETQPLQPPVYPIEALAPQLEEIRDGLDREIAVLIRAQEEASYQKQLAEFKLKVERFEEELAAFLMLMMMDD